MNNKYIEIKRKLELEKLSRSNTQYNSIPPIAVRGGPYYTNYTISDVSSEEYYSFYSDYEPPPPPVVYSKSVIPLKEEEEVYKIQIENVETTSEKKITDIFSIVGNLKSVCKYKDSYKNYAIAEYSSEESAKNAIIKFNGLKLDSRKLLVYWYKDSANNPYKIIIYNLALTVDEEKIRNILSTSGDVKSLKIEKSDKDNGTNKAIIIFNDREAVDESKKILDEAIIDDLPIQIEIPEIEKEVKPQQTQLNTVFVGCLSEAVSEDDLRREFEKIGEIYSIKIFRQKTRGKSPDYAYVNFINPKSVDDAVKILNGKEINGRFITVQYSRKNKSRSM